MVVIVFTLLLVFEARHQPIYINWKPAAHVLIHPSRDILVTLFLSRRDIIYTMKRTDLKESA